jgi:hypothetical protein
VSERIAARETEIGALLAAERPTVPQVPDQPGSPDSSDGSDSSISSDVSEGADQ